MCLIKESLIQLIGPYELTQYSWLDIPWICSVFLLGLVFYCMFQGLYCLARKYAK